MKLSAFENIVLFHIAVYSVPYLESGLCKLDKELQFYSYLAKKQTF